MQKSHLRTGLVLLVIISSWCGYQYWSITTTAKQATPEKADVIIVLGAAVWQTGPSPALDGRIICAAEVYSKGWADNLILSGGEGEYPPSEAVAMKEALIELGVHEDTLYIEEKAKNTAQNIKYSKEIMDAEGWESAIIVTDAFHLKRAMFISEGHGIKTFGVPAKNSILYKNDALRIKYTLREVVAITNQYINVFKN